MPADATTAPRAPVTSLEVRERLVEALNLDLIGPGVGHDLASERLPGWVRPYPSPESACTDPESDGHDHRGTRDMWSIRINDQMNNHGGTV